MARYEYIRGLAESSQERARKLYAEYLVLDCQGDSVQAAGKLNDYFYWIGHANAYRGIALQVDFMETVEEDEDEEASCP